MILLFGLVISLVFWFRVMGVVCCLGRGVGLVCGGDLFWCWVVWVLVVGLCVDVLLVGSLFTGGGWFSNFVLLCICGFLVCLLSLFARLAGCSGRGLDFSVLVQFGYFGEFGGFFAGCCLGACWDWCCGVVW